MRQGAGEEHKEDGEIKPGRVDVHDRAAEVGVYEAHRDDGREACKVKSLKRILKARPRSLRCPTEG